MSSSKRIEIIVACLSALILLIQIAGILLVSKIMKDSQEANKRFDGKIDKQANEFNKNAKDLKQELKEDSKDLKKELKADQQASNDKVDKKIKEFDKTINEKVDFLLNRTIASKFNKAEIDAGDRIDRYLEKDFSKALDDRYLKMEYVYNQFWNARTPLLKKALSENNGKQVSKNNGEQVIDIWDRLFKTNLALRELLSGNDRDVFDGLGILDNIIKNDIDAIFPKDPLWELILLLKEQNRLSPDNYNIAKELGRKIGKSFIYAPH